MNIYIDLSTQRNTLKTHGKSFYLAGAFLGRQDFSRATALYSFLRHVDDQIDEAPDNQVAAMRLQTIRQNVFATSTAAPAGDDNTHVVITAASLEEFLRGMAYDIGQVAILSEAELLDYCYCVAGTVGEMMCQALCCDDPRATNHAIDLGIAMQLTNIARDVYADALLGRRYIPAPWVESAPAKDIITPDAQLEPLIRAAILRLIALSEQYYHSAYHGIALLPVRSRLAIVAASRLYGGIGQAIYAEHAVDWRNRKVLGKLSKFTKCVRCIAELLTRSELWRYKPSPALGKPASVLHSAQEGSK